MPELPEVETVVRDLRPLLVGRSLLAVRRTSPHGLRQPWDAAWERPLAGARVETASRRGKWIVLGLGGPALVVHLGMTGQLTVVPAGKEMPTHNHFAFPLDDGQELRYRDTRRFGSVTYSPGGTLMADEALGPEPWELDGAAWRRALAGSGRAIKAVLLDQGVVAGVGNIYADEALFRARLHPARKAGSLTAAEATRLRKAVVAVLDQAIEKRGSTIRDYVGGSGLRGGYQDEFAAYGRTGEPCRRCGAALALSRVAGRSSHYCPACQPVPSEDRLG
ncbi:MAG: bifunctional DNA-formamidopyrimidine glycosylase/DNA-(apurinic or apyrimidinic site) lyase [Gemmataceae bacterium]|nr:bifunctional DNA-formamidopyrimidine glycosylase/DNA-(apurinic or apyrimidinic site) lyase [Gemmataceae bacterium]